jgi:hypothetical protein
MCYASAPRRTRFRGALDFAAQYPAVVGLALATPGRLPRKEPTAPPCSPYTVPVASEAAFKYSGGGVTNRRISGIAFIRDSGLSNALVGHRCVMAITFRVTKKIGFSKTLSRKPPPIGNTNPKSSYFISERPFIMELDIMTQL